MTKSSVNLTNCMTLKFCMMQSNLSNTFQKRWEMASLYCRDRGGFLATVDNEIREAYSQFEIKGWYSNGMWIGLSRSRWYWVTGKARSYSLLSTNQGSLTQV